MITRPAPLRHMFHLRNMSDVSEGGAWTDTDRDGDRDRPCEEERTPGAAEIIRRSSGSVEEAHRCASQLPRTEKIAVKYSPTP